MLTILAANAAACQYAGDCREGRLPFTGWEVTDVLIVACVLIGLALFIRGLVGLRKDWRS